MKDKEIFLSVISPVYQAGDFVDELVERIMKSAEKITDSYEIILVEDRSRDNSWEKIRENCKKHPCLIGLRMSRNFGQQYAIQAGLDKCRGQYAIIMDCDLQDPPEEFPKFLEKAEEGYEIVLGQRIDRQDNFLKKFYSRMFYKLLSYLTDTLQDSSVANYILIHRKVIDALGSMNDIHRYYPMFLQLVGFDMAKVEIQHEERRSGGSSYTFRKRLRLAFDTILNFSNKPLKLTIKFGVGIFVLSFLAALVLIIIYLLGDIDVPGWTSLSLLLTFFTGAIISVLGMVGLYVGQIFNTVKQRPTYILSETIENKS